MRVAIDLLVAEKEPGGMLFSTLALLEGLARIDQTNEYIIITAHPKDYSAIVTTPNIHVHAVTLRSQRGVLIQHQLLVPEALRRIRPDVLHVPAFAAPISWRGPLVLTVHDLAFLKMPHQSSLYAHLYWQYVLRESARRAQRIIAVSEQTRDDLTEYWAIEKDRISLVYNALRSSLLSYTPTLEDVQGMRRHYGERYLLHVGRVMPRKNLVVLIEAFDILATRFSDLQLVLTGGTGFGSEEVLEQILTSPYRKRIHLIGWISDQALRILYAAASVLVFPSLHEGFGLPTVEAMACGAPVVASHSAASMDIAGNAVMRADCSAALPLADAITELLADEALRKKFIQLGRIRAQRFTVERCAEATLRAYHDALIQKTPGNFVSTYPSWSEGNK